MLRLRIIILPLIVIVSIVVLWVWVKPTYQKARSLSLVEKQTLEVKLSQEKELQERINKLSKEEETQGQLSLIGNALPKEKEVKNLLAQLEFIVQKEKMVLKRLSVEDEKEVAPKLSKKTVDLSRSGFKEVEGEINVEGSYNQFKTLLKDIGKLDRITNVIGISVKNITSSSEEGSSIKGDYTINIKSFWQEAVDPESVKTSLESLDSSVPSK